MSEQSISLLSDHAYSAQEIIDALNAINVDYSVKGEATSKRLRFSSLFSPRENGIYFLEGKASNLTGLAGSLFIASMPIGAEQTIIVSHPQVAYYKLMQYFFSRQPTPQIHPTAIIDNEAEIHSTAYIGPYCVVEKSSIGKNAYLSSHVVVMQGTKIGNNVVIESHSTIGATGVAWVWCPTTKKRVSQPQIGGTAIGDDVFIGTDVTIVRGSINEFTTVGEGTVIAHGTKIGHGTRIGKYSHFANNVSVAGNVTLGGKCFLGAASVIRPQITLADATIVGAGAVVVKDQPAPSQVLQGVPAVVAKSKHQHSGIPKSR